MVLGITLCPAVVAPSKSHTGLPTQATVALPVVPHPATQTPMVLPRTARCEVMTAFPAEFIFTNLCNVVPTELSFGQYCSPLPKPIFTSPGLMLPPLEDNTCPVQLIPVPHDHAPPAPLMVVGPGVICASAGPAASRHAAMQPAADSIRRMKIRIVIPPASVCSNQNTPTGTMNRRNFVAPSLMRVNSTSMA